MLIGFSYRLSSDIKVLGTRFESASARGFSEGGQPTHETDPQGAKTARGTRPSPCRPDASGDQRRQRHALWVTDVDNSNGKFRENDLVSNVGRWIMTGMTRRNNAGDSVTRVQSYRYTTPELQRPDAADGCVIRHSSDL